MSELFWMAMRSPVTRLGSLALVGLTLAACGGGESDGTSQADVLDLTDAGADADGGAAVACTDNTQCRGGEICAEGFCRRACDESFPCEGPLSVCDPATRTCVDCLSATDCASTEACIANTCTPQCTLGAPCGANERCDEISGECVEAECAVDEDCPGGNRCRAGRCIPIDDIICVPGEGRCDENTLEVCNIEGTAYDATACGDFATCTVDGTSASCVTEPCEPNAIGCVDVNTAFICEADGETRTSLPCREDQYCADGVCLVRACEPDTVVCENGVITSCNALGSEQTIVRCADEPACIDSPFGCTCGEDATCEPRACIAGAARCVGNSVQTCLADESGYGAPAACGGDEICRAGACISSRCTAGSTECAGDVLLTCSADGSSRGETDCAASALLCTTSGGRSVCGPRVCEPDTVTCSADRLTVLSCDARGATLTPALCPAGERCIDGACAVSACDPRTCTELAVAGVFPFPDTDGDGLADCEEGADDSDGDGAADCDDTDRDGDTLADSLETGCPLSTSPSLPDSDVDGWDDAIETAVGSNPCSDAESPETLADTVVELPAGGTATEAVAWSFGVERIDVALHVDTTGSFATTLNNLETPVATSLISTLQAQFPDVRLGLAEFRDFPCGSGYGAAGDYPFRLRQRITANLSAVTSAFNALSVGSGGDLPETGLEGLFQIATGTGNAECAAAIVPSFNPATNRIPGVADGTVGGIGFREDAARVVLHVTDALTQARDENGYPYGATRSTTARELRSRDIRVVPVRTGGYSVTNLLTELQTIASNTNALLPPCAFGPVSTRPGTCTAAQCCTGVSGAGRSTNGGGNCPASFDLQENATDGAAALTRIVNALSIGLGYSGNLSLRGDPALLDSTGFDTASLVTRWSVASAQSRPDACGGAPAVTGTTISNGRNGVIFNLSVTLDAAAAPGPGVYPVYVDFTADAGMVLDSAIVLVIVD